MFRLHERTQRRICRVLFVACCVVPMVGVVVWIISMSLPSQSQKFAAQLSSELGLAVEIGRVSFPQPGAVTCRNVSLGSRGSGSKFATIGQIEIAPLRGDAGNVWRLERLRTTDESLQEITSAIRRLIDHNGESYYVFGDEWEIAPMEPGPTASPLHVTDFRLRSTPASGGGTRGRQTQVQFRRSDARQEVAIRIETGLSPTNHKVLTTVCEFNTGDAALRCGMLGSWVPAAARFGPAAQFTGKGKITIRRRGTDVELSGKLTAVDLDLAMGYLAVGSAKASGSLTLDSLKIRDSQLESAQGAVECDPGTIDRRLVDAAVRALYCVRPDASQPPERLESPSTELDQVDFDELAFRFSIDGAGMTLWGACESAKQGTMIARAGQSLLTEPRYRALPLASLVYVAAPRIMYRAQTRLK